MLDWSEYDDDVDPATIKQLHAAEDILTKDHQPLIRGLDQHYLRMLICAMVDFASKQILIKLRELQT
jgi:hypothetical protein